MAAKKQTDVLDDDDLEQDAAATATMEAPEASSPSADESKKLKRKPKQERLPGMEEPSIEEIETAAEKYRDIRDERMSLQKDEAEAHGELVQVLHKHGRKDYEFDGYKVELVTTEKARVRREKDDASDDDDE